MFSKLIWSSNITFRSWTKFTTKTFFCLEKDIQTLKVVIEGLVDVTRYIHVQPNVADIYSDVDKQIEEKFHDFGLSKRTYSMYWKDEDGAIIEIVDSIDLRYVMENVSPDTTVLFVRTYVNEGNHVLFRNTWIFATVWGTFTQI